MNDAKTVEVTPVSLYEMTLRLLKDRPKSMTYELIAQQTGLTVGWLRSVAIRATADPGVNSMQKLYEYLAKKRLEV